MVVRAVGGRAFSFGISAATMLLAMAPLACSDTPPGGNGNTPGGGASSPTAANGGTPNAAGSNGAPTSPMGGSPAAGGAAGNGSGGSGGQVVLPDPSLGDITPLFDATTELEPAVVEDTPTALITRWSDRARDRHAREARFNSYEHYLHIYWENRVAEVEIVDTVGKGGNSVTFNVKTLWKLDDKQAELRFFFRGAGTAAEYSDNKPMDPVGNTNLTYTRTVSSKPGGGALQVGDKMEFELSQFLDKNFNGGLVGRDNYYGTTMLYVAGKGLQPWAQTGDPCTGQAIIDEPDCKDSEPIPEPALLGGYTSMHELSSGEPEFTFLQMAGNMSSINGQKFMLGRRAIHTSFDDGHHDEHPENPFWTEQAGKLGPLSINKSCNQCHSSNSRAVPPATGTPLNKYVFKVGDDENGTPSAQWGGVLQPTGGEPSPSIASWAEEGGLRKPVFAFNGGTPTNFSPRVAPQLVGMGLLEAISEVDILRNADPDDTITPDGISGRVRKVNDAINPTLIRVGRFGWKAGQPTVKQQVAAALRTDMGVLTSVFPTPDCGSAQQNCGPSTPEFGDTELDNLTLYMSLLSVRAQRNWANPEVVKGKEVFMGAGCASCHTPEFKTSEYAVHAELRSQTIRPYTDLLLHDMGEGLADTLAEGEGPAGASYTEWRTPPLWGIGYTADTAGEESYLHDGRARTLAEAILWHGGEGQASKDKFVALSESDKNALIAFLKSL